MASVCINCQVKVNSNRQFVTCGFCKQVVHRTCTDINRTDYQKEQKKGRTIDWHCNSCWNNIQQNGQLCNCSPCHKRRIEASSFDFPSVDNTVSSMDTSQLLSPIRNPQAAEHRRGMHVSSWEQNQLTSMLNTVSSANQSVSSSDNPVEQSNFAHSISSVSAINQSGPTWIQPETTDTTMNNTSVEIRCCREPIVSATPPRVTFIVTTVGSSKGGVIVTANPYGWKYSQESKPKYFVCTANKCKGRLIIQDLNDTSSFKMKGCHTCAPNMSSQINIEISQKMKSLAKENPYKNASELAKQVIKEVLPETPSQPLSGIISKQNLCQQGNRARQDKREKIPRTKDDLLTMQLCKEQFPGNFFRWSIKVSKENDERRHVFFATEKQITYLAMSTEWRIDSTFKLVASPFTQLFSIHSPIEFNGKEKQYALG